MNQVDKVQEAVDLYRHMPMLAGNLGELRRGALKGIIGCVSSQRMLQDTYQDHLGQGYTPQSPFMVTIKNRLEVVEQQLSTYEAKHGQLSKRSYTTR